MFDGGGERSDLEGKRAAEEQLYAIPTAQPTFRCAPESLGPMQTGAPKASVSLESFVAQARALTMLANKSVVPPKDRSADAGATGVILVPSYASWYKMNEIHSLERKAMSEWFTGTCTSKTVQSYVEARDLIVKLFRESPNRYLTATECRRHLSAHAQCHAEPWQGINSIALRKPWQRYRGQQGGRRSSSSPSIWRAPASPTRP